MINLRSALLRQLAVRAHVRVGNNFHVGPGSIISASHNLTIGHDVYVGKYVSLQVNGRVGSGTLIANNVGVVGRRDHDTHEVGAPISRAQWIGDRELGSEDLIEIGPDVWIGYGAIVLSGLTIGRSSVIAAGSIVTRDVPENSIVAGIPARIVGQRFSPKDYENHWRRILSLPKWSDFL